MFLLRGCKISKSAFAVIFLPHLRHLLRLHHLPSQLASPSCFIGRHSLPSPRATPSCFVDRSLSSLTVGALSFLHLSSTPSTPLLPFSPRSNRGCSVSNKIGVIVLVQRRFMGYLPYGRHVLQQIVRNANPQSSSHSVVNPLLYACQGLRYRKLEVILTTSIDKLGKAGETVKVAPGYFRNHLMPKLLAMPNIDKFSYLIREQRKIYQPSEEEEQEVKVSEDSKEDKMRDYQKAALRLDKTKLVLRRFINAQKAQSRQTKDADAPLELLSAVTKEDLVAEVSRQLFVNIAPDNLHLPTPLSTVGEFEVPLRLPRSLPLPEGKINWTLRVKIRSK